MSLRVWLPLNGDLHNQGLSNISLSGSPTWGTGKIGEKSFCCNTGITGITINDLVNVTEFSIAYWLYIDSSITDFTNYADFWELQAVSGNTTTIIRDELRTNTANLGRHALHMIKDASVGSNTNTYYGLGERDDAKDKWCHVVITKDENYCDAYADGVRYAHAACSNFENSPAKLNGKFWLGMGGCKSAYLNDFRIYDHCLSPMEIKELAKGLVLHYPLNRNGWGQENLLANTATESTATSADNSAYPSPTTYLTDFGNEIFTNTEDYFTYSCNYEVTGNSATGAYIYTQARGSTASGNLNVYNNPIGHYSHTFKLNDTQVASTSKYCRVRLRNATDGAIIKIWNSKLEKGSIETPWSPASSDTLADTLGLNSTIEYDCSGYENNGTRTGTFTWSSDTPKYNVSTQFNGSNYIKTLPGQFTWSNYDNLTIAAWMKPTTTPSSWTGSIGIANDASSYTNKAVTISNYGGKFSIHIPNGSSWGTTQSTYTIPLNTWHHCVATISGTTVKMYIDGALNKTFTADFGTATNHTNPQIEVGVDLPGTDEIYNGYYSDVRIYATALSADDVKSLYQNSAYIDSSGNVYGAIHSEV